MERFWSKVDRKGPDECWLWLASTSVGYGQFWMASKMRKAHRVSYELLVGPIPDGLVIDHLCRTPRCVNPRHLEPVTNTENLRRGEHRSGNTDKTHCPAGHPYDAENTHIQVDRTRDHTPYRVCRACRRLAIRRWRERRKAS